MGNRTNRIMIYSNEINKEGINSERYDLNTWKIHVMEMFDPMFDACQRER